VRPIHCESTQVRLHDNPVVKLHPSISLSPCRRTQPPAGAGGVPHPITASQQSVNKPSVKVHNLFISAKYFRDRRQTDRSAVASGRLLSNVGFHCLILNHRLKSSTADYETHFFVSNTANIQNFYAQHLGYLNSTVALLR